MAITTVDGAIAGAKAPQSFIKGVTGTMVVGRAVSTMYLPGVPAPAVAPTPGIDGAVLTSYAGQLPFANPASGYTYLNALNGMSSAASGMLYLCDRLWHNSGMSITSTSLQTIAGANIPARDENGLTLGHGVYAGVEVSTVTGAGTPTLTINYMDQDGNTGAIATNTVATVAASVAGTFYQIGLAAGDSGIRKIEGYTQSATWTSGTVHVVLYRIIAALPLTAGIPGQLDMITGGFPRMYDNSVPFFIFVPGATTTTNLFGNACWSQG